MKTATISTPVGAALELLAAAEQRIVDADQASAKADAYRDSLDLQLRDGADSISADDLLHADAECRRAAMIAAHARDALGPAREAVDRAELAAAITDARDYANSPAANQIREYRKAERDAKARADALTAEHHRRLHALAARIRDHGGAHLQPGQPGDGWCGQQHPGALHGFSLGGGDVVAVDYIS
jgi:hypothetical protein